MPLIVKRKLDESLIVQCSSTGEWCEIVVNKITKTDHGVPKVELACIDPERHFEFIRTETEDGI